MIDNKIQARVEKLVGVAIVSAAVILAFDIFGRFGMLVFPEQILVSVIGFALWVVFTSIRFNGTQAKGDVPWYDWLAAIFSALVCGYIAIRYPVISRDFFYLPTETTLIGLCFIPLVLEALRRSSGALLFSLSVFFVLFGLFGHLAPGALASKSKDLPSLLSYLSLDGTGVLGMGLGVVVKIVVIFIMMGQLLRITGGSQWFTDISDAVMGHYRGGPAKTAAAASALFGSVSGSAVANVAATGVITIPLMKKAGFKPAVAGGIEAVVSTGGQFAPPVMGAAGFLMAEFLEVPYRDVFMAAIIPALLCYFAIFIQIDLEAAKRKILGTGISAVGEAGKVFRQGWYFILPFVFLLTWLFKFNRSAEESALVACLVVSIVGLVFGYKGKKATLADIGEGIWKAGISSAHIIMIGAMAGIVLGIIEGTGLGFGITFVMLQLGDSSMFLLLLMTGVVCIILGMGMPTTGIYLLLAALAVPALVNAGVPPIAAHFFVLYCGCLSMITPPLAVAAFTAASIAEAKPIQTSLIACKLGWVAFVIPFLFVYSPELLFEGNLINVALVFTAALLGIWVVCLGLARYCFGPISSAMSALLLVGGSALLLPYSLFSAAMYVNIAGLVLSLLVCLYCYFSSKTESRDYA